ncbi:MULTISPECIES: PD-(D/E)XK nuclease family protein [Thermoanaerobacterium]|uniref:ATP-dependent nuclease subunit B-like protein n=2 Tax=Thermoanaerobacterium TaxID=28895 RepID=W9ECY2_9THEO|nr:MULTISPECIES: PD-(D/E)XK nuclease family protein [Thermoanaerobacterium]AFK87524.1 ATP-dependent nuclease subunit B-like protein [Thermoanaerobacterium saccharolyticum JW/SL-YS485]ETO37629.1 ATP-dependent nuclease subunit B-like protein [Thermoanaerobacterium aotearoense SCUT27]
MKEIFFGPFCNNVRDMLIEKSMETIRNGKRVLYILPSREAMFDVRDKFIKLNGGIVDADIFVFEDIAKLLCGDFIKNHTVISTYEMKEILRSILQKSDYNGYYQNVKDKAGFLESVLSFIKTAKRNMLNPNDIKKIANSLKRNVLKEKLNNLAEIYINYEDYKNKNGLIDVDDISVNAIQYVDTSNYFSRIGIVVVDGFINLDGVNMQLLKKMALNSDHDIYVNIPFKNEHNEIFIKNGIVKDLLDIGFRLNEIMETEENADGSNAEKVSKYLYSGKEIIKSVDGTIMMLNSPSIEHEVRETARLIKKKIVFEKVKPENIAVFVKNIDDYRESIIDIFDEMGIPLRFNDGKKLMSVMIASDIYSLITYKINRDFKSFDSIMKSKYLMPNEIIDVYNKASKLIDESYNDYEEKILSALNDGEFEKLKKCINMLVEKQYKDISEFLESILNIIEMLKIDLNIMSLYESGVIDGRNFVYSLKALEAMKQILKNVMELKRRYGKTSSDDIETIQEDLLDMMENCDIMIKNLDIEGVKVINPDLARGQRYDVVFILGANEGDFPTTSSANPIFDSQDEAYLGNSHLYVFSRNFEIEREKIRFNSCIASSLGDVYISYRTTDKEGNKMIKSPFVYEIESLFDKMSLKKVVAPVVYMKDRFAYKLNDLSSEDEIMYYLANSKCDDADLNILSGRTSLAKTYQHINYLSSLERKRVTSNEMNEYTGKIRKEENLKILDGIHLSASGLNSYVACPFSFFVETLLDIKILDESIEFKKNIGSTYHEILMKYYSKNEDLYDVNEEKLKDVIDKTCEKLDGIKNNVILEKFKKEMYDTLFKLITDDISNRLNYYKKAGAELIPSMFEKKFEIDYGGYRLYGKIDRIDLERSIDGNLTGKYLIYDYKLGTIGGLRQCIDGLDFQLPTYYMAAEEILSNELGIENPSCLGLLYYSVENVKRNGILLDEYKKYLFKGNAGPRDVLSKESFDVIIDWIEKKGIENADRMMTGSFNLPEVCPYDDSNIRCPYASICRYDRRENKRGENGVQHVD